VDRLLVVRLCGGLDSSYLCIFLFPPSVFLFYPLLYHLCPCIKTSKHVFWSFSSSNLEKIQKIHSEVCLAKKIRKCVIIYLFKGKTGRLGIQMKHRGWEENISVLILKILIFGLPLSTLIVGPLVLLSLTSQNLKVLWYESSPALYLKLFTMSSQPFIHFALSLSSIVPSLLLRKNCHHSSPAWVEG
jgi:hypothetical protein